MSTVRFQSRVIAPTLHIRSISFFQRSILVHPATHAFQWWKQHRHLSISLPVLFRHACQFTIRLKVGNIRSALPTMNERITARALPIRMTHTNILSHVYEEYVVVIWLQTVSFDVIVISETIRFDPNSGLMEEQNRTFIWWNVFLWIFTFIRYIWIHPTSRH